MNLLHKRLRVGAFLSILAWSGTCAIPAMAQEESEHDWLECFQRSAPDDLATALVDEFIAKNNGAVSPAKPSFQARFGAVLLPCVIDDKPDDKDLQPFTIYMLRWLGEKGSRERLLGLGISQDFLDKAVAIFRRKTAGEDTKAEIKAAVRVEAERAGLSEDSVKLLPFLLSMYADSRVTIEAGPPSF